MKIHFYKYHGCGNDFILVDNRMKNIKHLLVKTIRTLCHRRFGVGADGIMILKRHNQYDFEMEFYNSSTSPGKEHNWELIRAELEESIEELDTEEDG